MSDFPVNFDFERKEMNIQYDTNVFPKEANKLVVYGHIRKKKVLIMCKGEGNYDTITIEPVENRIKTLKKLYEGGYMTEEEYNEKKRDILNSV